MLAVGDDDIRFAANPLEATEDALRVMLTSDFRAIKEVRLGVSDAKRAGGVWSTIS